MYSWRAQYSELCAVVDPDPGPDPNRFQSPPRLRTASWYRYSQRPWRRKQQHHALVVAAASADDASGVDAVALASMRGPPSFSLSSRRRAATTDLVKVVTVVSVVIASVVTIERLQYLQTVLDGFNCCAGGDVPPRYVHRSTAERNRLASSAAESVKRPSADACWHPAASSKTRHNASDDTVPASVASMPPSVGCGALRRKWARNRVRSPLARRIEAQQTNCSLPVATYHMDNAFGLGSHLHVWSQAMCNALEAEQRLQTYNPVWLWMDQTYCSAAAASRSPLLCYFPLAEDRCRSGSPLAIVNVTDPKSDRLRCSMVRQQGALTDFRTASMEYIFQEMSPLVVQEARRQAGLLFGPGSAAPDNMITVHMRWGDKFWEMDLPHEDEYVAAVARLSRRLPGGPDFLRSTHVYLATEDPRAADAFLKAAPDNWTIYIDRTIAELNHYRPHKGNRASWAARNSRGRAGLVALGSLLVALEARFFVLTTQSNWSRLLDQLRRIVIDHQCGNCTEAIDLRPGEW